MQNVALPIYSFPLLVSSQGARRRSTSCLLCDLQTVYRHPRTIWLELQREKGESAHDAWKVGEEYDSKPSVIDHVELKHLRKKLRTFG